MPNTLRSRPVLALCALSLFGTLCLPVWAAAGDSTKDTRAPRALQPVPLEVPEPGTLALVGVALAVLVLRRKRSV